MCFPVPYAGFFAKSQIMFFLPSSFRFCPPLKNDGTSELRFSTVLTDFLYIGKNKNKENGTLKFLFKNDGASELRFFTE